MRTITSSTGLVKAVSVRRSESTDAPGIDSLINPSTRSVFGKINAIHLLEKANLAVTLADQEDTVVAHACFSDHPAGGVVNQAHWEPFLQQHFSADQCTPLNTLFIHLFVARESFATAAAKEIMRVTFNAVPELEHICLVGPHVDDLEPALEEVFELLQSLKDPEPRCSALVCCRQKHGSRLHVRPARAEDLLSLLEDQKDATLCAEEPFFLTEVISAQNDCHHTAVCEIDGVIVGFMSGSTDLDMKQLGSIYDLSDFEGLYDVKQQKCYNAAAQFDPTGDEEEQRSSSQEEVQSSGTSAEKSRTFRVQLFSICKSYKMRSVDFISYLFQLLPNLNYIIITVSAQSPEAPLLQDFIHVPSGPTTSALSELYIFNGAGRGNAVVRPAAPGDWPAVSGLVKDLDSSVSLLQDLDHFYTTGSDPDAVPLQAFVAQVDGQVIGILIIRDEQDVEYLRAHYNIENFIYFSHHCYDEHAHIRHFVLRRSFQFLSRHLFKEVLRLAHRSCLYHRLYPRHHQQGNHGEDLAQDETEFDTFGLEVPDLLSYQLNSCIYPLDCVLSCGVPVRPRRQIIYPLEDLGTNTVSSQITKQQAPFALSLISRKLTLEPKVTINARIVVVGASDAGLSVLEELCSRPHLRFNNLTLISTHGFPGDCDNEDVGFLSTSHAYSSRDLALVPLRPYISVVTGKMVGINRKSKHVLVSSGETVPYHHLVLCTGLQYQVPRPGGMDVSQLQTVPPNLFTLNNLQDCTAAHRWLCANFIDQDGNVIVYGNGIDVYTTTETLLSLGVRGSRIHLVLPPLQPSTPCFMDPAVQEAVTIALENADVWVHHNCLLAQMNNGGPAEPLTSVSFTSDAEPIHLQCRVFLNLSSKGVDHDASRSIRKSHLAFISRLVIDVTFQTSDPAIYGAGPLTKFSSRYYSDEWSHMNFSSKEVGRELAARLVTLLDSPLEPDNKALPGADHLVPLYKEPKIQGGRLPGGFHYLHVTKPSPSNIQHHLLQTDEQIVSGRVETGNYFSLHLDLYEHVQTLTCLSLKSLPSSNYLSLYGKHEQLLGGLLSRYQQGQIQDLYSFFRQSWCLPIFHDRFSDLQQELQQIISNKPKAVEFDMRTEDEPNVLPESPEMRSSLRISALNYLTFNRNLLPMFAHRGLL